MNAPVNVIPSFPRQSARPRLLAASLGVGLLAFHGTGLTNPAPNPTPTPVPAKRRFALVIGNARYALPTNALANPVNDARLVADTLRKRNLDVTLLTDLTTAQMEAAVDEFATRATGADLALVYFA